MNGTFDVDEDGETDEGTPSGGATRLARGAVLYPCGVTSSLALFRSSE